MQSYIFIFFYSFGANIRLTSATVSNGSWIQAGNGGQGTFNTPLRAAAITVGARHVRPEQAKMIHIPQPGSVPQIAQVLYDSFMITNCGRPCYGFI